MRRLRLALLALVAVLAAAVWQAAPAQAASGFVARSGTSLADEAGRPLRIDAVNLGGFLMWEGWMLGGGMDAESSLYANLVALVGAGRAERFRSDWRERFVTLADMRAIRAMGFDTVRLPFNHRLLANDAAGGFATLDRVIADAEAAGLRVILDLHGAPGGQSRLFIADPSGLLGLWRDRDAQDRTVALWRAVAARYAGRSAVAGYDLLNEPDAPSSGDLVALYERIVAAIREVDPNHLIIVEGNDYAHDFTGFTRLDENLAFSFHQYPVDAGDPDVRLATWIAAAEAAGVPLINGEYGQGSIAQVHQQRQRFGGRAEVDGQMLWSWKLADRNRILGTPLSTAPAPSKFTVSDDWFAVTNWLSSPATAPRPTPAVAEAGLTAVIDAIAYERTTADSSFAALLRPAETSAAAKAAPGAGIAPAGGAGTVRSSAPAPSRAGTGTGTPRRSSCAAKRTRKARAACRRKAERRAAAVARRRAKAAAKRRAKAAAKRRADAVAKRRASAIAKRRAAARRR